MSVFVIAEAATTWRIGRVEDQHVRYARKSMLAAKAAGADAWKTQWVSEAAKMEARRQVPRGTYEILAWPQTWLPVLARECERLDIEFMCTVFLPQDIVAIAPFVKRYKVASLEALDAAFVSAMPQPTIVSLGALDVDMIRNAPWLWSRALLQCTASYPAPLQHLNLGVIAYSVNDDFNVRGLSDHSCETLTGALATAAGAQIIEVHFRLDETRKDNPDYYHSHSPNGLTEYIVNIRKAEIMLGDGVKKIEECEKPLLKHRVNG